VYALRPYSDRTGWVASTIDGNRFGEPDIRSGTSRGTVYLGAFQFDLSFLPPGTSVDYAALELSVMEVQPGTGEGGWSVHILGADIDPEWKSHGYNDIRQAETAHTLFPVLKTADLAEDETVLFVFDPAQRTELELRIERGAVSFRVDGPTGGSGGLVTWDSGSGGESNTKGPTLRLAVRLPTVQVTRSVERIAGLGTPTPTFVVITPVPTPANMLTVAASALTATSQAVRFGTPTPLPPNWVTPIIVTPTSTPLNEVTATALAIEATADAVLTGTPTPTPGNVWTATPTPTYVIITSVPTPANTLTAVADALALTAQATTTGTPTPLPPNWVTPVVITATPTPGNATTATVQAAAATWAVIYTGTPTPTPVNLYTATATSTPRPTSTATATFTPPPPPTDTPPPPPPPPPTKRPPSP
jgi:hypothetical protein